LKIEAVVVNGRQKNRAIAGSRNRMNWTLHLLFITADRTFALKY
jgi:hypothetical protein